MGVLFEVVSLVSCIVMMSGCVLLFSLASSKLRVDYKMLLYTFYDHERPYICDMITKYKQRKQLRSSDKCMLVVPKIRTKEYDARSFLYASATLWN